jgi:hypothetical protein
MNQIVTEVFGGNVRKLEKLRGQNLKRPPSRSAIPQARKLSGGLYNISNIITL